jgi:hypothetical protein
MPFDNAPDGRFSDIQLLWAARSRIGDESGWVQTHYSDGDRLCLVAQLRIGRHLTFRFHLAHGAVRCRITVQCNGPRGRSLTFDCLAKERFGRSDVALRV